MPCNCDYMEASDLETEISRVACLLDEIRGKKIERSHWNGYHPDVYNSYDIKNLGDRLTAELCEKLSHLDVTKMSDEMQEWWEKHRNADDERIRKENQKKLRDKYI